MKYVPPLNLFQIGDYVETNELYKNTMTRHNNESCYKVPTYHKGTISKIEVIDGNEDYDIHFAVIVVTIGNNRLNQNFLIPVVEA